MVPNWLFISIEFPLDYLWVPYFNLFHHLINWGSRTTGASFALRCSPPEAFFRRHRWIFYDFLGSDDENIGISLEQSWANRGENDEWWWIMYILWKKMLHRYGIDGPFSSMIGNDDVQLCWTSTKGYGLKILKTQRAWSCWIDVNWIWLICDVIV